MRVLVLCVLGVISNLLSAGDQKPKTTFPPAPKERRQTPLDGVKNRDRQLNINKKNPDLAVGPALGLKPPIPPQNKNKAPQKIKS
jgi:hypothetical protein